MFHCIQTNNNAHTYIEFRVDGIHYSGATEMENTDTIVLHGKNFCHFTLHSSADSGYGRCWNGGVGTS